MYGAVFQSAEKADLKSVQYGFESHVPYHTAQYSNGRESGLKHRKV